MVRVSVAQVHADRRPHNMSALGRHICLVITIACLTYAMKNAAAVKQAAATIVHDMPQRPAMIADSTDNQYSTPDSLNQYKPMF